MRGKGTLLIDVKFADFGEGEVFEFALFIGEQIPNAIVVDESIGVDGSWFVMVDEGDFLEFDDGSTYGFKPIVSMRDIFKALVFDEKGFVDICVEEVDDKILAEFGVETLDTTEYREIVDIFEAQLS